MSRKLPGSAIVSNSITLTQISGSVNDTSNAAYGQANSARDQANTGRTQANTAYDQANNARSQANTGYDQANTAYDQANTARTQANTAYGQANAAYGQANAAYGAANNRLLSTGGTLSGDLIITGNLTVSGNQTILNTEVLTTEDADIILLSNTSSTPALNAGLIINRGTSTNTFLRWDEAVDEWGWSDSGTTTYYFEDLRQGLGTINTTFGTTNTTFGTVNTTFATLNTSAGTQNTAITTANDQANTARGQANTGYGQANAAYGQANAAYGAANNRVLKAGDTMTGQLNISSGGLLVTGNVGIGTATATSLWSGDSTVVSIRSGSTTAAGLRLTTTNTSAEFFNSGGSAEFGIYSGNASPFTIYTNGSERLRVLSGGDVGIGTTNPQGKQHNYISSRSTGFSAGDGTTWHDLIIQNPNNTQGAAVGIAFELNSSYHTNAGTGIAAVKSTASSDYGADMVFITRPQSAGAAERARITSSGDLCVGSTEPGNAGTRNISIGNPGTTVGGLQLWSTTSGTHYVQFGDSASGGAPYSGAVGYVHSVDAMTFWTAQAERMRITSGGNVGIGITNPGTALDVNGTIRSRLGSFQLNDGTSTGGGLYFYKTITGSGSVLDPTIFAEGTTGTGNVYIMTGGSVTPRVFIRHDGNVGIGITNPSNKLSVADGNIFLTQNYGITWNNGDNYIKGVSGYHVDTTTYDGSSAQQDGIRVVGGTSKSARLIAYGGVRYGRALQSTAANKVIRGWHNYTTSGSSSGTIYVHFKTNMWAGGSPSGNIQYTMSLFRATGYSYNAHTIDSLIGFHNWSGSHYNIKITDLGSKAFWSTVYTSTDGYTVLVGNLSNYNYDAVSIDWFQTYEYPFVDAWVTAQSTSANLTGVY